jgi:hypothetical protein
MCTEGDEEVKKIVERVSRDSNINTNIRKKSIKEKENETIG